MGCNNCFFMVWFVFNILQSGFVRAMDRRYDSDLLNDFLRDYAYANVVRPRTGVLYRLSLPSNFSDMEVSFKRFRTKNFYSNGINFNSFDIPPSTEPTPFVRRFDLIYENLGNWSSYYYNVPNYTLASPVIGLSVYNATNLKAVKDSTLSLSTRGGPILVHFPRISLPEGERNVTTECARFGPNGLVEITNMTSPNVCAAQQEGHFAIIFRATFPNRKKKVRFWKWWVIGFGAGFVTFVILGVIVCKFVKRRGIVQMEKESERNEVLGTTWIGDTKMPSAEGIRTQPVLMNEDAP